MTEFTILGLRVVRAAARHGSFSMAAEQLGYTQSAVSRQIALMERAAGRPLFERQARGVRLTEAGRLLVRRADAMLGELRAAQHDLRDLGARAPGRLRVGAFSTAMAALVPRAIRALVGQHPHLRVPLREGLSARLLTSLTRGRLDAAVVTAPRETPEGIELTALLDDPLVLAVPPEHPLAEQQSVPIAALRDQPWIAGSVEPNTSLLGAWHDASWAPDIAFVARDWVAKLGLVAAGLGITVVPGIAVPALPPTISLVRIDDPSTVRTIAIAYRAGVPVHDSRPAFTEALLDAAAALLAEVRRRLRHPDTVM
jgi:DNA-binding transcriptional LysR family regulator